MTVWRIIVSMRPGQWTKNLVLFAGVVFSNRFLEPGLIKVAVSAFAVFCVLSGAVYLINDVADRRRDRGHPGKGKRPIAQGTLGPATATATAIVLAAGALAVSTLLGREFLLLAAVFLGVNLLYTFALRSIVILDVIAISFSFLIRAMAGVVVLHPQAPGLELSPWLWICTLFLSLFLAVCKRRYEFCRLEAASEHRASLKEYSAQLLDQLVGLTATSSIISYSIYTVWPATVDKFHTRDLVYTIPFVVFGIMRYLYLVYTRHEGGDPSGVLLAEKAIIADVFLWFVAVAYIIGR